MSDIIETQDGMQPDTSTDETLRAYRNYERVYSQRNPPPRFGFQEQNNRLVVYGLCVLVLSAVIVSASRTIPEFASYAPAGWAFIVGIAASAMSEIGLIVYPYVKTRLDGFNPHFSQMLRIGLWLTFIMTVAANINHTLKDAMNRPLSGQYVSVLGIPLDYVIAVFLGAGAPMLARISGDVLGMLAVVRESRYESAKSDYDRAVSEWREQMNRSFTSVHRKKADSGQRTADSQPKMSIRPSAQLPDIRTVRPMSIRPVGQPDKRGLVMQYLKDNPDAAQLSVRDLSEQMRSSGLDVGKSVVAEGKSDYLRTQNGHSVQTE